MAEDEPHALNLEATLSRMEPGLSVPSIEQSLASIAISLKRIADIQGFNSGNLSYQVADVVSALGGRK